MFQFRRFPTYYYFIHSTLTRYCRAGFPHSDIHGSQDICSSPWLFAACRVLHRLLMPRHSPCALYSLTFVIANFLPNSKFTLNLFLRVLATCYGLHSCSQNYAGIHRSFSLLLCYPISSTFIAVATLKAWRPLLPCFSSSSSVQFSRCRNESHSTGVQSKDRCCQ